MSIIIINRARVRAQLGVIDDDTTQIYEQLKPEQKDIVEAIRCKSPQETTAHDWQTLLDICKSCP